MNAAIKQEADERFEFDSKIQITLEKRKTCAIIYHRNTKNLKQSRIMCVKCRVNRELSSGRKVKTCGTWFASRCYNEKIRRSFWQAFAGHII